MDEMDKNLRYWQDKYTRLLEGHRKLQSVNQLLEEKLINIVAQNLSNNDNNKLNEQSMIMENKPAAMDSSHEEKTHLPSNNDVISLQTPEQHQLEQQRHLNQPNSQQDQQIRQSTPQLVDDSQQGQQSRDHTQQQQQSDLEQQQPTQQQDQLQSEQQQPLVTPQVDPALISHNNQQQEQVVSNSLTKVKIYDELNIFDWFKTSGLINQIAEKAKSSVDSVITVLDPGMKSYLFSGGNINVLVNSDKESIVASTREAFQEVFGRATINKVVSSEIIANENQQLPSGVTTGLEQAITISLKRIRSIREDKNRIPQNQVILDIEPTLTNYIAPDFPGLMHDKSNIGLEDNENSQLSKWFYTYSMILDDPVLGTFMNSFSQPIPVDLDCVNKIKSAHIDKNEQGDSTIQSDNIFSKKTIDEIMTQRLNLTDEDDWIEQWTGISTHTLIYNLSKCVAHLYKRKWQQQFTESN